MYILQSIAMHAKAVWQTETLPMPRAKADKLIRERMARQGEQVVRRYRLMPA